MMMIMHDDDNDDDDDDDDDDEWHYKLNHYGMAFTFSMRRDI